MKPTKDSHFLVFVFCLLVWSASHAQTTQCFGFYGGLIGPYLIPKPGSAGQNLQVVNSKGGYNQGFIYEYKNITHSENSPPPQRGSFEYNQQRVAQAPKWFGLFNFSLLAPDRMSMADLVSITQQVSNLKQKGFSHAPTLVPGTYNYSGPIKSIDAVKLMAEGKFVVSTKDSNWWRHDIFDHGFPGYMVLPPQIANRLVAFAQLLMALNKNQQLSGATRQMIEGQIERFAGEFDELSQNISTALRDGDQPYIIDILARYSMSIKDTSSFINAIKKNISLPELIQLEQMNQPFSSQDLSLAYHYIVNAYSGNWVQ